MARGIVFWCLLIPTCLCVFISLAAFGSEVRLQQDIRQRQLELSVDDYQGMLTESADLEGIASMMHILGCRSAGVGVVLSTVWITWRCARRTTRPDPGGSPSAP